ncbi:TadE/TadG family type IV pilus assembly protein [Chthonobacter rhizosphaerae]|uniref:TadE/TadG family type IV pilus assembly protein n=1 Tax=Chthonobacter rhizosphaerae TaxID=2735553 RepID=UPI0015EEDB02|nr:TadE/TadG family type IV pilus assembly protein [Chthonobacter rhizosphaerae]
MVRGQRFLARRDGAIAPAFAILLVPLLLAAGAAVDYGRVIDRRAEMQGSLDAGVLAAASTRDVDPATAKSIIRAMVDANLSDLDDWVIDEPTVTADYVRSQAEFTVPTTFMRLMGMDSMSIALVAEARRPRGKTEVALVLDNTGSMASGNKIGALRTAAADLVDILEASVSNPADLKIAVVPFVTAVNIKSPGAYKDSWIDRTGAALYNGQNMQGTIHMRDHWSIFDALAGVKAEWAWKGCVEARPEPFALDDTPPTASNPNTLFVPYLWPDEPDEPTTMDKGKTVSAYDNSYLVDQVSGNVEIRQALVEKYRSGQVPIPQKPTPAAKPYNTHGPNKSCGQPVLPLTTDLAAVRAAIAAMQPWDDSGTNVAEGIMWGLRVLSPEEPFSEGANWSDPVTRKYLVVLTDGANVIFGGDTGYAAKSHNKSQYTSWGYVANGRFDGASSIAAARDQVDVYTAKACEAARKKGITIHAITFLLNDAKTKSLFRACADAGKYYDSPKTSDLAGIFASIARDITPIRLAR